MADRHVVIVGAGPAGTRAAQTLVRAGLRPVVIDEAPASGGQIYRRQPTGFRRPASALYGFEAGKAQRVHAAFDALAGRIDWRPGTLVWDARGGVLHLQAEAGRSALAYVAVILATGAMDRILPLPGWTLPGVYTLGGAQVALKAQGCAIGRRVALLGSGPLLYLVAYQYAKAGAQVAAVLDTAPFAGKLAALPDLLAGGAAFAKGLWYLAWLAARRVPMASGVTPLRIEGTAGVARLVWRDSGGTERATDCDAIGMGWGLKSETQLADLLEVPFAWDALQRQWLPQADADGRTPVQGVYLCGDGAAIRGADAAELAGERAALALLADRGITVDAVRVRAIGRRQDRLARFRRGLERAFPYPHALAASLDDGTLLCRCEAVTAGELRHWVRGLDAREINRAKAFSRVGMGRCQGRVCGPAAAEVIAAATGQDVSTVGRLRGQPPVKPIPIESAAVPGAAPGEPS